MHAAQVVDTGQGGEPVAGKVHRRKEKHERSMTEQSQLLGKGKGKGKGVVAFPFQVVVYNKCIAEHFREYKLKEGEGEGEGPQGVRGGSSTLLERSRRRWEGGFPHSGPSWQNRRCLLPAVEAVTPSQPPLTVTPPPPHNHPSQSHPHPSQPPLTVTTTPHSHAHPYSLTTTPPQSHPLTEVLVVALPGRVNGDESVQVAQNVVAEAVASKTSH